MAITDTGSVAAISTPNSPAPSQPQPTSQCMPAATTTEASTTPIVTRAVSSGSSRRNAVQGIWIAASNTSGGRSTKKISAGVNGGVLPGASAAMPSPATTSPAL